MAHVWDNVEKANDRENVNGYNSILCMVNQTVLNIHVCFAVACVSVCVCHMHVYTCLCFVPCLSVFCYINTIVCIYEYKMIGAFVFKKNWDIQCGIVFENNKENKPQIDALNHNDHCFVRCCNAQCCFLAMPFIFSHSHSHSIRENVEI